MERALLLSTGGEANEAALKMAKLATDQPRVFDRQGAYDWTAELDYVFDLVDRQFTGSLAVFIAEPISAPSASR